jgi:hypothetical protein
MRDPPTMAKALEHTIADETETANHELDALPKRKRLTAE